MQRVFKMISVFGIASAMWSASAVSAGPDKETLNQTQWIERMQSHWEQVIQESDPQKRQELLREHEQMMVQAAGSESGQTPRQSSPSAHGMDSSHVDMMNTVDMHRHMMDMMR